MPTFTFHCHACGKDFESLILGREPIECAHCDVRVMEIVDGGVIVRKFAVSPTPRIWKCSSEGAMPKGQK
jgi:DNA-directed RNA polymerase subunit RPC12/RpoP